MVSLKWEPRNLEEVMKEVEEIERKRKRRIDPKIKPLVRGLRRWGINTTMSCQGHYEKFPFPWVSIALKDVDKLLKICGWYNLQNKPKGNDIRWVIFPMTFPSGEVSIRLVPRGKEPLEKLQESAIEFGKCLQKLPELPIFLQKSSLKTRSFLVRDSGCSS